jgi:hypothetical protein
MRKASDVHFDALRNAIYHSARRRFYDTLNRAMSFIVVAAGTAAVSDLFDLPSKAFAFAAALAGLLQLVFDFSGKARTHEFLQRRFYELVAEMNVATEPTAENIATWDAKLHGLYAEEPPPMRAMDAIAYNAALESLGKDPSKRIKISWVQSWLRHVFSFNGSAFPYVSAKP